MRSEKNDDLLRVFLRENPAAKSHNYNQSTSIAIQPRATAPY